MLDWGDASVSHPFVSLVVTFRFLEEVTRLPPEELPGFDRGFAVILRRALSRTDR